MREEIIVDESNKGLRVDILVASHCKKLSRNHVQKLIKEQRISVDGRFVKASQIVEFGQIVDITLPEPKNLMISAEQIPLDIVFEDGHLIIIDKPAGMVVHPAVGHSTGTLVNALLAHCDNLPGINGIARPGIVHRLDKDTSGLIMVAKTEEAMHNLSKQLKERTAGRKYYAIVRGYIKSESGTIDMPIGRHPKDRKKMSVTEKGGKPAKTDFCVVEHCGQYTIVACKLHSGRTHQIRVHMAYIGHPILGDAVYGSNDNQFGFKRQALHAYELSLRHPVTSEEMKFTSNLPQDMVDLQKKIKNRSRYF